MTHPMTCTACLIAADTAAVILPDGTTVRLCWDCAVDATRAWDYCPACDRPTALSAFGQCVPGDGNSESVCPACAAAWQASHTWDDALGEWVEADSNTTPDGE